jgi:hypothetical protein
MQDTAMVDNVLALTARLSPAEKAHIIAALADELASSRPSKPRGSFMGVCADLGPAPTDEDIDEVRREMMEGWA